MKTSIGVKTIIEAGARHIFDARSIIYGELLEVAVRSNWVLIGMKIRVRLCPYPLDLFRTVLLVNFIECHLLHWPLGEPAILGQFFRFSGIQTRCLGKFTDPTHIWRIQHRRIVPRIAEISILPIIDFYVDFIFFVFALSQIKLVILINGVGYAANIFYNFRPCIVKDAPPLIQRLQQGILNALFIIITKLAIQVQAAVFIFDYTLLTIGDLSYNLIGLLIILQISICVLRQMQGRQ